MKKLLPLVIFLQLMVSASDAQTVKPSARQLQWQQMEFYLFLHFGPNTFTDLEWGKGTEQEEIFNPTALDCRQWCRIAKAAGAKGLIITAKHHDGFCLWPTRYSTHTVAQSKWRNGKGDVVKELAAACREYGLKLGIYLSPWDRNHPKYGTPAYNDVFVNMMKEVVSRYGPLFEFWWDGANGEGPNGKKQVYDWHRFEQTLRSIAPNTPVFSDIGPDIRWVGNESGFAGKTNWNLLDTAGFTRGSGAPSTDTLNSGNENGKNWIPAECDVSIRPGWFYHKQEDSAVKKPAELFQLYLKSVGRGSSLLLNVPPDRRGLINEHDSAALMGFKKLRNESFGNDLVKLATIFVSSGNDKPAKTERPATLVIADYQKQFIEVHFKKQTKINCVVLKEAIKDGQSVQQFYIQVRNSKQLESYMCTTVGRKRIITFPAMDADDLSIHFNQAQGKFTIASVEAYFISPELGEGSPEPGEGR
jgi:alpha-L-fucosidase